MTAQNVWFAFNLTLLAGLSTGIGSAIAFFARRTNTRFLSVAMGFSAGVMVYVSFVEILAESRHLLSDKLGARPGEILSLAGFFGGILLMALIDRLVPNFENPHEMRRVEDMRSRRRRKPDSRKLMRMGVFSALAIAIHNFPEGIATFLAALQNPALGVSVAVAVAIHNIPEGIAVSVPVYYATGSRKKAFALSFLSGLAEPLGALIGWLILARFLGDVTLGAVFAVVAGIMIYISFDELLPSAQEYGEHHLSILGLFAGMGVMALSLILIG